MVNRPKGQLIENRLEATEQTNGWNSVSCSSFKTWKSVTELLNGYSYDQIMFEQFWKCLVEENFSFVTMRRILEGTSNNKFTTKSHFKFSEFRKLKISSQTG
jgi:hypothetical protein